MKELCSHNNHAAKVAAGLEYLKISSLNKVQREVIESVTSGKDTVFRAPRCSGKMTLLAMCAIHRVDIKSQRVQVLIITNTPNHANKIFDTITRLIGQDTGSWHRSKQNDRGKIQCLLCAGRSVRLPRHPAEWMKYQIVVGTPKLINIQMTAERRQDGQKRQRMFAAKGLSAVYMVRAEALLNDEPMRRFGNNQAPPESMQDQTLEVMSKINQGIQIVASVANWDDRGVTRETIDMIVDSPNDFEVEADFSHQNHWFVYAKTDELKVQLLTQLVHRLPFKKGIIFVNGMQNGRPPFTIRQIMDDLQHGRGDEPPVCSRSDVLDLTAPSRYRTPPLRQIDQAKVILTIKHDLAGLQQQRCRVIINYDVPKGLRQQGVSAAEQYMHRASIGASDQPCHIITLITELDEDRMGEIEDANGITFEELPGDANDRLKFE